MMKKIVLFVTVLSLLLVLTGCGKEKEKKTVEDTPKITLKLGDETFTFSEVENTCGNYQIQSKVIFTNEQDETGNYKGSYEFYECNDNNVNLETAEGTYITDDEEVIFTDTYGQNLTFEITDDNTIIQKYDSQTIRTFTK